FSQLGRRALLAALFFAARSAAHASIGRTARSEAASAKEAALLRSEAAKAAAELPTALAAAAWAALAAAAWAALAGARTFVFDATRKSRRSAFFCIPFTPARLDRNIILIVR